MPKRLVLDAKSFIVLQCIVEVVKRNGKTFPCIISSFSIAFIAPKTILILRAIKMTPYTIKHCLKRAKHLNYFMIFKIVTRDKEIMLNNIQKDNAKVFCF